VTQPSTSPGGAPQLPGQIAAATDQIMGLRTGTLISYDDIVGTASVDIGGTVLQNIPYLDSYLPILGDYVQVLTSGSSWQILGKNASAQANDVLANPSFEGDADGSLPSSWRIYHDPVGTATASVYVYANPFNTRVHGRKALAVQNASAANFSITWVYSEAIPVAPNDRLALSTVHIGSIATGTLAVIEVDVLYFANSSDTYPTTVAIETGPSSEVLAGFPPVRLRVTPPSSIDGAIVVPAGANFASAAMKIGIFPGGIGGSVVLLDNIIFRKL